jgi:AraC-like DNA-binding protein
MNRRRLATPVHSVCVKAIRGAVAAAAAAGVPPERALQRIGLAPDILLDPVARVPHAVLERAWRELPELSGDAAFGLHAAELAARSPYDVVDFATSQCATLRGAIAAMTRYQRLIHDANDISVAEDGEAVHVRQRLRIGGPMPPHLCDYIVGQWLLRARALTGVAIVPRCVELAAPPPQDRAEHQRLFGAVIVFDADANQLVVDQAVVALPIARADASLETVLRGYADALTASTTSSSSAAHALEAHFASTLAWTPADIGSAAKALSLSPRTLQRRLEAEGTSFKRVLEEFRRASALTWLRDGKKTLSEVAFTLGFSEISAFSRAFRRWTGTSASDYRRALQS